MKKKNSLSPITLAVQASRHINERTGGVTPNLNLSTTYARDTNYDARQSYIYGRDGGETLQLAETILSDIQNAESSLCFSSGMSGFTAICELLNTGDHIIAPNIMYHGGIDWLYRIKEKRGIKVSFIDQTDMQALEQALKLPTRFIWIETPANPNWDIVDIKAVSKLAKATGAKLIVDTTVAPPCTSDMFELGVDLSFQSATKYLGGHSDLLAGVISCKSCDEDWAELTYIRKATGTALSPFSAWLLVRGMRTLYLRYERASQNALAIAMHFEDHPKIKQVLYPGLANHPGHQIAKKQMQTGFGGMLSFMIDADADTTQKFVRSCNLFIPATSLGGVESLIEHRKTVEGINSLVPNNLVRISVGCEHVDDLISDLEQALNSIL